MFFKTILEWIVLIFAVSLSTAANAFFFIVPLPNFSKPAPLNVIIEALEKSEETKAVAYVSEDKMFGAKYWVWGHHSGHVTQAEADRTALDRCRTGLANAKAQTAGGKELYNFGSKTCELYSFVNKTVSPRAIQAPASGDSEAMSFPEPAAPRASTAGPLMPASSGPSAPGPGTLEQARPTTPTSSSSGPAKTSVDSQTNASEPSATAPSKFTPIQNGSTAISPSRTTNLSESTRSGTTSEDNRFDHQPAEGATARRLRELNRLLKEGLITEAEYNEKRKAILSAM